MLAGFYVSLGATAYLITEDKFLKVLIFSTGIMLVLNFFNMLFTRVVPLFAVKEYGVVDIFVAFFGNFAGAGLYALALSQTRLAPKIMEGLAPIVEKKLSDSFLSLFVMAICCAVLVAYGVFCAKKYKHQTGLAVFFYILFISAFVIAGFDHVVANMFYMTMYGFNVGFEPAMVMNFVAVALGNTVGGLAVGYLEIYRGELVSADSLKAVSHAESIDVDSLATDAA